MNNIKKNAIWNTVGITLNSFNSLFFLVIINRINGVNIAGIFSFSFSVACLLYIVGIYSGRTFQVTDIKNELTDKEYLYHKCITCFVMMLIAFFFIFIKDYSMEKNIIIILLCLYKCFEAFSDTLYGYLQKNDELHIVGKSLVLKSVLGVLIFFIVDLFTKNLIFSCVALCLNSLVFILFYDVLQSKKYLLSKDANLENVIRLFRIGLSVFAFSFLAVYIVNIQKYIIDSLLQNYYQTVFGIIVMPGTIMSLCGQYIMAPLLNDVAKHYNQKRFDMFKNILLKIIRLLLLLGIVVEIAAFFLGIPVLNIVYAINLNEYQYDLMFIIFGAILYAIAGILSTALITMRKNNMQLLIYLISSVIGFCVSYLLINSIGIHGATLGYCFTMFIHWGLYVVYFLYEYKKLKIIEEKCENNICY